MLGIMLGDVPETDIKAISGLNDHNVDYCVFSSHALPEDVKRIPQLQPLRAYNFRGTMIATDIKTAEFASHLRLPKKKFFYIRSLEWFEATKGHPLFYKDLEKIYLSEDMDLIVSNPEDYRIISNLFKKPKYTIEDWDFTELANEYQE